MSLLSVLHSSVKEGGEPKSAIEEGAGQCTLVLTQDGERISAAKFCGISLDRHCAAIPGIHVSIVLAAVFFKQPKKEIRNARVD